MKLSQYIPNSPYVADSLKDYPEELSLLLPISKSKKCKAGELIYVQGQASRRELYVVEQGKVKISILSEDGSERLLNILENNTIFGYGVAFDEYPYYTTATAMEETTLRVIDAKDFLDLAEKHPKLFFIMFLAYSRVARMLVLLIEDFSFLDAEKRVAHMICKLAHEVGQKTPKGVIIRKKVTQEHVASLTGLSRVSVSLALNHFEDLDIIKKKRHVMLILDIQKLEALVGGVESPENLPHVCW
ncbi:MAG: cAMP receptor protein [Syntrophorhabdaceae bacterium PtaU1.Bin034]|nr:MAG: cAMP receptor protein [Syntrophorhabdaceae bacterium PtaU1.Bin034]